MVIKTVNMAEAVCLNYSPAVELREGCRSILGLNQ
jgi:hypothetical protein